MSTPTDDNIVEGTAIEIISEQKHHDFSDAIATVIANHGKELTPTQMIAILSYVIGGLLSLLPDEVVTDGKALALIQRNLEAGNSETNALLAPLNQLIATQQPTEEDVK